MEINNAQLSRCWQHRKENYYSYIGVGVTIMCVNPLWSHLYDPWLQFDLVSHLASLISTPRLCRLFLSSQPSVVVNCIPILRLAAHQRHFSVALGPGERRDLHIARYRK